MRVATQEHVVDRLEAALREHVIVRVAAAVLVVVAVVKRVDHTVLRKLTFESWLSSSGWLSPHNHRWISSMAMSRTHRRRGWDVEKKGREGADWIGGGERRRREIGINARRSQSGRRDAQLERIAKKS